MAEYIIKINDNDETDSDGGKRIEEMHRLVRCKDCKHYTGGINGYCERWFRKTGGNEFFCADGELKD